MELQDRSGGEKGLLATHIHYQTGRISSEMYVRLSVEKVAMVGPNPFIDH